MILSDISVKRPVLATVLSLILVVFGIISYQRLSLREYPDIDPPVVTVDVNYPGAPANIVETRVTKLIEERIAGIEGIEFIESSSQDGESKVTIEFSIDRDIDAAANDIRDRISGIQDNLPEEAEPPEVQKTDSNDDVVIWRNLASDRHSVPELTDYANRYLVDRYSTLDGVARIRVGGSMSYAVRIWLDRQEMAARNLTVSDIESSLRAENVELPAGSLESSTRLFQARVERNFTDIDSFKKLTLSEGDDGNLVRLGDVARVEIGVEEDRTFFRGNGETMVGIGTIRQSTANTIDVARGVKELTARINPTLPEGMEIKESYDESVFIESAIAEVYKTLGIAVLCVILVIYLFLGSARAMLIPALTVPISLTATFLVIDAFGFSINLLTLLALVLAIGLVVDDAIVMLENIVRRIKDYDETPLVAAYKGARQVGFAVVSTTLVLVAVFVPITFLEGDLGSLFKEFAITISAAVCFSSIVALTLSPMLASKLLRKSEPRHNFLIRGFDVGMRGVRRGYVWLLDLNLRFPLIVALAFVISIFATAWIYNQVEEEFTPTEDRGVFVVIVNAPEGASHSYTADYMTEIERRLLPYVESGEMKRLLVRTPRGFGNLSNFNSGICIIILEDWAVRRPAQVIMNEVRADLSNLPGVRAFPVMRQALGGGNQKPVQFVLGGSTYEELAEWRDIILEKIEANNPGFVGIDSNYKETRPQLDIRVDYEHASELGVTVAEIGRTLETMMGGRNVTTFLDRGEEYEVVLEGERDMQRTINDMENIYVRSDRTRELIPLSNLVTVKEYGAAQTLSRYNRVRAITLEANLAEGYRLGDALAHLEALVRAELPEEAVIDYKGQSRDYITAGSSMLFIFLMGLAVVFLVLSAQFESFVHPFVIMLTVPATIGGGLLGLYLTGNSLNIYSQIGLIMLVGLAAKNGVLIVEFANQLRDEGLEFSEAITQACEVRLRPVLMTGVTTIAGSIPLILSSGAGAETRIVIGVVVLSGVLVATLLTLFVVPVAYNLLTRKTSSPNAVSQQLERETNS
ncbi:MAG: multidrug efflux pump [Candidatus Azotimanducaceae bacterium]